MQVFSAFFCSHLPTFYVRRILHAAWALTLIGFFKITRFTSPIKEYNHDINHNSRLALYRNGQNLVFFAGVKFP